jgi:hypothetical protein
MKITAREEILMRRALDPASSPAEAAKAAEAFVNSLRKRAVSGYDLVPPDRNPGASSSATPSQPTPEQQQRTYSPPPPPPPRRPRPQYQNPKWDHVRQQREAAQNQVAEDIIKGRYEDGISWWAIAVWGSLATLVFTMAQHAPFISFFAAVYLYYPFDHFRLG